MSNLAPAWTIDRYKELESQVTGYWAKEYWDLRYCPINKQQFKNDHYTIKFLIPSIRMNNEIKYVFSQKLITGQWTVKTALSASLDLVLRWLRTTIAKTTSSLIQKPFLEWKEEYIAYLTKRGVKLTKTDNRILKDQQVIRYEKYHSSVYSLHVIYQFLFDFYDTRPEFEKDIWSLRKMGMRHYKNDKLNFTGIHQCWLRQIVKKYISYRLAINTVNCCGILTYLGKFSNFLLEFHPNISAEKIDRTIIIGYMKYLSSTSFLPQTRTTYLIQLRAFLEISAREFWANFPKERIIYDEELPKLPEPLPRFIPEIVLKQLFQHLDNVAIIYQRMIYVLYEVGMRISELLTLQYGCLLQDREGSWWIKYFQSKLKTEHTQPISAELAAIIQAQQKDLAGKDSLPPKFLFPNSKGQPFNVSQASRVLNRLAIKYKITDTSGVIWHFEAHQFRHSFATRHINSGVPHHIVQRLLGHKSPGMTSRYAHILDKTLKQEYEIALNKRKLVDISGRIITENAEADRSELQWLKQFVDARTLPNGYCSIPLALSPCPHPNACLTCPHFRTDQQYLQTHEKQLEETISMLKISRTRGWTIQTENNERIINNLQKIIASLKEK